MVSKIEIPKEKLKLLYENKGMSTYQIAKKFHCCQATVWKRLHKFNIKIRPPGTLRVDLPKEKLLRLYMGERLSTWEIEKRYGYVRGTVFRKLLEYGIKPRSLAESHIIYPRKNFSGDPIEKAYLIGFAVGDLRVRMIGKNSETIHADCGSTKSEQIDLTKRLFDEYGHAWVSRPSKKGKIQIEVSLNHSFDFLLDPKKEIYDWISNSDNHFAAFLAGFTDAEGSIKIKNGRAIYQLGNYDEELLSFIRQKLMKIGIICSKIYESKLIGYVSKDGYIRNHNYYQFCVNRKSSLLWLFRFIGLYLKHAGRVMDMNKAKENIEIRNKMFG